MIRKRWYQIRQLLLLSWFYEPIWENSSIRVPRSQLISLLFRLVDDKCLRKEVFTPNDLKFIFSATYKGDIYESGYRIIDDDLQSITRSQIENHLKTLILSLLKSLELQTDLKFKTGGRTLRGSKRKLGGPLGDGDYHPSREKIMKNNPCV